MSGDMTLRVAGKDRAAGLGASLVRTAGQRDGEALEACLARERDVLSLAAATDAETYLDRHAMLLRSRNCVDPSRFQPPPAAGRGARLRTAVRRFLWSVLRHQHDWLFFRQNAVNVQLAYELTFEREARRRETAALSERLRKLEGEAPGE